MRHVAPQPAAPDAFRLDGRILFLCEDAALLQQQLAGRDLDAVPRPLCDRVSTDEMTPGWVCFWYDDTLGRYTLVGLRHGVVTADAVKNGGFQVLVGGTSMGCGSSRETAPVSHKAAGIGLVIAESFEKIYRQNCHNVGLLTSTDMTLVARLRAGETVPLGAFTQGLDPISRAVVEHGGLVAFSQARLDGLPTPRPTTPQRPMTLAEKLIARRAVGGVSFVQPGDAVFCRADVRFSHDYVTPMAAAQFYAGFGPDARVVEPHDVYAFRDHLTFLRQVMPEQQKKQGLLRLADDLAVAQARFCAQQGIKLYGETPEAGAEAICHNAVLEDIALPGQVVAGTDSHTCTAGALGCLAFGIGSTDMACAWRTGDVRVNVPASLRIELTGRLRPGVTAKDVMLSLMTAPTFRDGKALGHVLEFCGEGLHRWSIDERATLTNMAVEAGAMTGIVPADATTIDYLVERRGLDPEGLRAMLLRPDADAAYAATLRLRLDDVQPMVATPGDPRNGIPIAQLGESVRIDLAYGGSCTGGKRADMDMYAEVLGTALARGRRVHRDVQLFIQFGSQAIRAHAERRGYVTLFERAGAKLINPSCGACIKAGPGVSTRSDQVTISAVNRNYPGRSGPGQVYLASPRVVAASAVAGRIITPEILLNSL